MKNQTIRTEQHFIDKTKTMPQEGHFDVFIGRKHIGGIYEVEGRGWKWNHTANQFVRTMEDAVEQKVAQHESYKR